MTRTCSTCWQTKPWTDYWAAAKWPDGTMQRPQYRCKDCVKANRRTQRQTNPAKARARDRADRQKLNANPKRRARRRETQRENTATAKHRAKAGQ